MTEYRIYFHLLNNSIKEETIKADRVDIIQGCLVFLDILHNAIKVYAPGTWQKMEAL